MLVIYVGALKPKVFVESIKFSELLLVSHCEVVQAQQSVRVRQVRISDRAVIIPPSPVSYLE